LKHTVYLVDQTLEWRDGQWSCRVNRILNIDRDKQINQLRDQRDRAEKELKEEKVSAKKTSFLLCPEGSAT
jgi:hypothetical protein